MKTLEKDKDYEHVQCPSCGHKWHALKESGFIARAYKTIFCPKCDQPLKPPSDLDDIDLTKDFKGKSHA